VRSEIEFSTVFAAVIGVTKVATAEFRGLLFEFRAATATGVHFLLSKRLKFFSEFGVFFEF